MLSILFTGKGRAGAVTDWVVPVSASAEDVTRIKSQHGAIMDSLIGTRNCPHLGFDINGRPCCHSDDMTRQKCGRFAPNPAARKMGSSAGISGVEAWFCTALGTGNIPAEALRLGEEDKRKSRVQSQQQGPKYRPPSEISGQQEARPNRDDLGTNIGEEDWNPIIPTHTIRSEGQQIGPNSPCPCGSGKKHKKCCGRFG